MGKKIKETDAYIAKSADFAKPVLIHIRELVHKACPDVEENIKWGFPHFGYKNQMMCGMAAFKEHCVCGFWKGNMIKGLDQPKDRAMGQMGRMTSIKDLPPDKKFIDFIKQAMKLNELKIQAHPRPRSKEKKEIVVPGYFQTVLNKNKKAKEVFNSSSYTFKKDYVEWITEAKTEETRSKRIATALEWIAEGKGRNWKYERK